jgi:hypothetical protein
VCKFGTRAGGTVVISTSTYMTCLSPAETESDQILQITNNAQDYTTESFSFRFTSFVSVSVRLTGFICI